MKWTTGKRMAAKAALATPKGTWRGKSLGIARTDTTELIRLVRAGLLFNYLARFQQTSTLSWEAIAQLVQIPQRTLTRRQSEGRLRPDESDRVLRASIIYDLALDLFEGNTTAALRWLQSPQPGLGNAIPLDFASTQVGAQEVERLILRLEHGVIT